MSYRMKLRPDGDSYEFLTMGELAELCGRSRESIKKLTEKGILPEANFRTKSVAIKRGPKMGQQIRGYGLYSKDFLAPMLAEFLKTEFSQGKQITIEQKSKLMTMFEQEREQLLSSHQIN